MTKQCPYCAEEIKIEAIKCKHCGSNLSQSGVNENVQNVATDKVKVVIKSNSVSTLILGIILLVGGIYEAIKWGPWWLGGIIALVGLIMIWMYNNVTTKCKYCNKELGVKNLSENFICPKCNTLHVVDWN
jgi:tRNA(Ile2) C34 agmatinyltransferase TiaS